MGQPGAHILACVLVNLESPSNVWRWRLYKSHNKKRSAIDMQSFMKDCIVVKKDHTISTTLFVFIFVPYFALQEVTQRLWCSWTSLQPTTTPTRPSYLWRKQKSDVFLTLARFISCRKWRRKKGRENVVVILAGPSLWGFFWDFVGLEPSGTQSPRWRESNALAGYTTGPSSIPVVLGFPS